MGAVEGEKYCLKWNDFTSNLSSAFNELRDDEDFFDVTLLTEESEIRCHKLILGACSPHFRYVLGVPTSFSKNLNSARILKYFVKKFVKLKGDLRCLAKL